jgi:hypothetical protein
MVRPGPYDEAGQLAAPLTPRGHSGSDQVDAALRRATTPLERIDRLLTDLLPVIALSAYSPFRAQVPEVWRSALLAGVPALS